MFVYRAKRLVTIEFVVRLIDLAPSMAVSGEERRGVRRPGPNTPRGVCSRRARWHAIGASGLRQRPWLLRPAPPPVGGGHVSRALPPRAALRGLPCRRTAGRGGFAAIRWPNVEG